MKVAVIMDPIESIKPHKDTSFAMMLEAQDRGYEVFYIQPSDVYVEDGVPYAHAQKITVQDIKQSQPEGKSSKNNKGNSSGPQPSNVNSLENNYYQLDIKSLFKLADFDIILMRKDPPFDMAYIYLTYILDLAGEQGARVINNPQAIRNANEKLFISWFPDCCAPTLVTASIAQLKEFHAKHQDIVCKPLDGMGGAGIFHLKEGDSNASSAFELLTNDGRLPIMAQKFIHDISAGDKRIIMVDGKPVDYALARIPAKGEFRGNLAAGGRGEVVELSDRDREIANKVGPTLRGRGLVFVGLDVIGDYLTEINVTSPTCAREIDAVVGTNICGIFFDAIINA